MKPNRHLGLNWVYIRKVFEKSSIYGHLEIFFWITLVFLTKVKFYVRKKIGDMHVTAAGGVGVGVCFIDHFTVQRVSYWCFACCRKLSVCGEPWGIILECWIWRWFCELFHPFPSNSFFLFLHLLFPTLLIWRQLFLHYTLLFVSMSIAFSNLRMKGNKFLVCSYKYITHLMMYHQEIYVLFEGFIDRYNIFSGTLYPNMV